MEVLHARVRHPESHHRLELFCHHCLARVCPQTRCQEAEQLREGRFDHTRGHRIAEANVHLELDPSSTEIGGETDAHSAVLLLLACDAPHVRRSGYNPGGPAIAVGAPHRTGVVSQSDSQETTVDESSFRPRRWVEGGPFLGSWPEDSHSCLYRTGGALISATASGSGCLPRIGMRVPCRFCR